MGGFGATLGARQAVAALLVLLAVTQLGIIVAAFARVLDPGWGTTEVLGALYGIAVCVAVGAVAVTHPVRRRGLFRTASLAAAAAALVGALCWATLFGRAFLLQASQSPRIWAIIVADLVFAAWLLLARLDSTEGRAPGLGWLAAFTAARGGLEGILFFPLLLPATATGDRGGGVTGSPPIFAFLVIGSVLVGFIVIPLWEGALGRWLVRRGPSGAARTA